MLCPNQRCGWEVKSEFYARLQGVIDGVASKDLILLLGDFNAKVGRNNTGFETIAVVTLYALLPEGKLIYLGKIYLSSPEVNLSRVSFSPGEKVTLKKTLQVFTRD